MTWAVLPVGSTQLLRAQKKAAKKEQQERVEEERRRLSTVLRFQHLLASLQQEQIQGDLLEGRGPAPRVSPQRLDSLTQLSGLLGLGQRDSPLRSGGGLDLVLLDLVLGGYC